VPSYDFWVYIHILLFVVWLGGDIGVFILGQHFRKRHYPMETRLTMLKLLVLNDMGPRTAWALMVPVTLTLVATGGYMMVPLPVLLAAWAVGGLWLGLVWGAYLHDQTPLAARLRHLEFYLKLGLTACYLGLGIWSFMDPQAGLSADWLALKALLFGLIFAVAIMIDIAFKPLGPALGVLIEQGSSDATEVPVLTIMNRTRIWVISIYILLLVISAVGTLKPALGL